MTKKITFVLNVRYPTEKAYGVTTGLTAKTIANLGNYQVEIVTPLQDFNYESLVKTTEVKMWFQVAYELLLGKNKYISYFTFNIWKLFFPLRLIKNLKRKDNLIWTRDIYTTLFLNLCGFKTVCEIHRTPSIFDKHLINILKLLPRNNFIFLSRELQTKLKITNSSGIIAPVAVKESDIIQKKKRVLDKEIVIGYVGSLSSSGIKLSLQHLINSAESLKKHSPNIKFRCIGFSKLEFDQNILPENIEFINRISRANIMDEIDNFDIGLVIYPNSKYFIDSFPIKIVEYAARQIPIIASDTIAHKRILGADKAVYFDLNQKDSLAECIKMIITDENLRCSLSLKLHEWVSDLTYEKRVQKVLLGCKFT